MNKKIKEFYLESLNENQDFCYQEFANLIIKQCVEVCKLRVGDPDYNTGRMHCASDIAEYFGLRTPGPYEPKMSDVEGRKEMFKGVSVNE